MFFRSIKTIKLWHNNTKKSFFKKIELPANRANTQFWKQKWTNLHLESKRSISKIFTLENKLNNSHNAQQTMALKKQFYSSVRENIQKLQKIIEAESDLYNDFTLLFVAILQLDCLPLTKERYSLLSIVCQRPQYIKLDNDQQQKLVNFMFNEHFEKKTQPKGDLITQRFNSFFLLLKIIMNSWTPESMQQNRKILLIMQRYKYELPLGKYYNLYSFYIEMCKIQTILRENLQKIFFSMDQKQLLAVLDPIFFTGYLKSYRDIIVSSQKFSSISSIIYMILKSTMSKQHKHKGHYEITFYNAYRHLPKCEDMNLYYQFRQKIVQYAEIAYEKNNLFTSRFKDYLIPERELFVFYFFQNLFSSCYEKSYNKQFYHERYVCLQAASQILIPQVPQFIWKLSEHITVETYGRFYLHEWTKAYFPDHAHYFPINQNTNINTLAYKFSSKNQVSPQLIKTLSELGLNYKLNVEMYGFKIAAVIQQQIAILVDSKDTLEFDFISQRPQAKIRNFMLLKQGYKLLIIQQSQLRQQSYNQSLSLLIMTKMQALLQKNAILIN